MLFSEAIVKFSAWLSFSKTKGTVKAYQGHLRYLALYLHNCEVVKVNLDEVITYLKKMREIGWKENDFLVKCQAFRKFFEFLNKMNLNSLNFELIPVIEQDYTNTPKTANMEDYAKVLKAIPQDNQARNLRNRTMLMMYKDCGVRLGELLKLNLGPAGQIGTIDVEHSTAIIKTEKAKRIRPIRKIKWSEKTNEQLKKYLAKRMSFVSIRNNIDPNALFISVANHKSGMRLEVSGAAEIMRTLSRQGGLDYTLNSHSLRHSLGHKLAKLRFPNSTISTILGHKDPKSSYIYTMLNEDEIVQAMDEVHSSVDK